MSGWQLTLTKESKGKILGVWRGKTHHLHFPACYNSDFLWDLPLVLPHKHQLVRNHLLGCINYLSVALIEHHSKSLCFKGDAVPNDGKHGSQSVRLVLQMRVITFNLHPGSTGRENKSKDRLPINAWLHYVFLQQGFTSYSLTVSPMGSMCSQYTILRGHFSFGSRHPTPPSLTDTATTTGLPSGEIVIAWLSGLYHARHSNK